MKNILTLLSLCFLASPFLQAQAPLPPQNVGLYFEVSSENPQAVLDALNTDENYPEDNVLFDARVIVPIFSTRLVDKVHVHVGTGPDNGDHAQYSFTYPEFIKEPDNQHPYTFIQRDKTFQFGMGEVMGLPDLYVKVQFEDREGNLSEPRYYTPF